MNSTETYTKIQPVYTWYSVALLVQSCMVLLTNTPAICIISGQKSLYQRLNNLFLLGLLVSHVLTGVFGFIFAIYELKFRTAPYNRTNTAETFIASAYYTGFVLSFISLILVTIDRLLAIKLPMLYQRLTNIFYVLCLLAVSIFPATYLTVSMLGYANIAYSSFVAFGTLVVLVLIISNVLIYRQVKTTFSAIMKTVVCGVGDKNDKQKRYTQKRQVRSVRICLFIVLSFVIFWLPNGLNCTCILTLEDRYPFQGELFVIRLALTTWAYTNSIADPIIYILLNRDVRNAFKKKFNNSRRSIRKFQSKIDSTDSVASSKRMTLPTSEFTNSISFSSSLKE